MKACGVAHSNAIKRGLAKQHQAPNLALLLEQAIVLRSGDAEPNMKMARAELKAILAVVRAAQRWVDAPDLHTTVGPANAMVRTLSQLKKLRGKSNG